MIYFKKLSLDAITGDDTIEKKMFEPVLIYFMIILHFIVIKIYNGIIVAEGKQMI